MTASRTIYTARFQTPDRPERGTDWVLACPVYLGASLVTPTGGTCTVRNKAGETVSTGAIAVVSDIAEYTLAGADTTDQDLEEGWTIEWVLTFAGPVTRTFRNIAALVYRGLYPVIADVDLFRRSSALDPSNTDRVITDFTDYQDFREEAWVWLDGMLVGKGRRPQLIASPTDLREVHLLKTLALIYADLTQRGADVYAEVAASYEAAAMQAWSGLSFAYLTDEEGQPDTERQPAVGSVWLNGRSAGTWRGWP